MMDAKTYLKERNRMTEQCSIICLDCPLYKDNNGKSLDYADLENLHPDTAISIVEEWSKEHPVITNKDKFDEIANKIMNTFDCDISDLECRGDRIVPKLLCKKFNTCSSCINFWNEEYKGDEK